MQVDTALNIVWLALGISALAITVRARRGIPVMWASRPPMWLQICGVALTAATLFPYISATDDVLRIQHNVELHAHSSRERQHSGNQTKTDALIRLFEAMDTPVVGTIQAFALTLFFVSFVVTPTLRMTTGSIPLCFGRSPPASAA